MPPPDLGERCTTQIAIAVLSKKLQLQLAACGDLTSPSVLEEINVHACYFKKRRVRRNGERIV